MDAFSTFLQDIQNEETMQKEASITADRLSSMTYEELTAIEQSVNNVDYTKVSHVVPTPAPAQQAPAGNLPHGLTDQEADLINKISAVDFAARQMARQGMEKDAGARELLASLKAKLMKRFGGSKEGISARLKALKERIRGRKSNAPKTESPKAQLKAESKVKAEADAAKLSTPKGMSNKTKGLIAGGVGATALGGGALYSRRKKTAAAIVHRARTQG